MRRTLFTVGAILTAALAVWLVVDIVANNAALLVPVLVALLVAGVVTLFLMPRRAAVLSAPAPAAPRPATPRAAPRAVRTPASQNVAYFDYKGDVHDVIDVEGIGPTYAKRLEEAGIRTTARLCYEDAENIASVTGAPVATVRSWQAMAELAKVKGIGKQYAEALVRGGVPGIEALKTGDPAAIAAQVSAYLDSLESSVLGQNVTATRVRAWQKDAAAMRRVRQRVPAE